MPAIGYGIAGEVAELSQGRVQLKIGSLYGVQSKNQVLQLQRTLLPPA